MDSRTMALGGECLHQENKIGTVLFQMQLFADSFEDDASNSAV